MNHPFSSSSSTVLLLFSLLFMTLCIRQQHVVHAIESRTLYDSYLTTTYHDATVPLKPQYFSSVVTGIPFTTVHNISIHGHCSSDVPCNWYLFSKDQFSIVQKNPQVLFNTQPDSLAHTLNIQSYNRTLWFQVPHEYNKNGSMPSFESMYQSVYFVVTVANVASSNVTHLNVLEVEMKSGIFVDMSWIQILLKWLFGTTMAIIITCSVLLGLVLLCAVCCVVSCFCCCCSSSQRNRRKREREYLLNGHYYYEPNYGVHRPATTTTTTSHSSYYQ